MKRMTKRSMMTETVVAIIVLPPVDSCTIVLDSEPGDVRGSD